MTHAFEPAFERRDGWLRLYPDLPGLAGNGPPVRVREI